jgi:hypothetical protein
MRRLRIRLDAESQRFRGLGAHGCIAGMTERLRLKVRSKFAQLCAVFLLGEFWGMAKE